MGLQIRGLVRAARSAQDRLRRGIAPEDRDGFLGEVREHLRVVRQICDDHDARLEDLPAPSRRALVVLDGIVATAPGDLPLPGDASAPEPPVRVRGVVRTLDRVRAMLAARPEGPASVEAARRAALACVEHVHALCAEQDATPAGLPPRTGPAFGMLAWLGRPGHADLYARQHDLLVGLLGPRLREARPATVLQVAFTPGGSIYRFTRRGRLARLCATAALIAAPEDGLATLVRVVVGGGARTSPERAALEAVVHAPAAVALREEIRRAWQGGEEHARGRAYDLGVLFDRLNARFFDGALARPRMEWRAWLSSTRFGFARPAAHLVVLDARLDDPAVPEFVAECVLFHELLHLVHGSERRGGRRRVHTPAFRRDEQRHPRWADAETWVAALARGEVPPPA
jgi:hypothetical protein